MKPAFRLATPYGAYYTIMDGGEIQRDDGANRASEQWRILGIQHVKRREFIPFADLARRLPDLELRYKNGAPQWTVRDFDHGTMRVWGNTHAHGIKHLYPIAGEVEP
jgi:hypothetical protein